MSAVGAWNLNFDRQNLQESVYSALKNGVRLIDTAKYYGNEEEGEEIFVTTKIVFPAASIQSISPKTTTSGISSLQRTRWRRLQS